MKKITVCLIVLTIFFSNCTSSKKYLARAQFNAAVNKSVSKLRKKPTKTKEMVILKEAYSKANSADIDRINFLKSSGEPDIWDNIFSNYSALKNRQEVVKTLPTDILNKINFVNINYDQEIITAKKKAAEYFYARGILSLDKKDRQSARSAYADFQKVKQYYYDYADIDNKINEALFKGRNNILFKVENRTNTIMPANFEEELLKININEINSLWMNYDTKINNDLFYDYAIVLRLMDIAVSPEQVKEESYTDQKEINDGFKYQLDKNGNVVKDSSGKDIKIPIIKVITCQVVITHQYKSTMINGVLDYINNKTGQLIKSIPLTAESVFENHAALPYGDLNALSPKSRNLINSRILRFPSNPEMIMQTNAKLKDAAKNIIWNNRNVIDF
jgi:hypothetical protein